jgi:uridylate kinase
VKNPIIIKFGGSSLDNTAKRIRVAAEKIELLSRKTPIIVTVGGGEVLATCLHKLKKQRRYETKMYDLDSLTFHPMNFNCHLIRHLMDTDRVDVIESGIKQEIIDCLAKGHLAIVPRIDAETFISAPKDLTPKQSDLTTAIIAEELEAKKVIFMKNLPGICTSDPNFKENLGKNHEWIDQPVDLDVERKSLNLFVYKRINPQQIAQVIHHDHCIEKDCLDFIQKSKNVKAIYFVGIAKPSNLEMLINGDDVGSKLIVE